MFLELPGLGEISLSISHTSTRLLGSDDPNDAAITWVSTLVARDESERETTVASAVTHVVIEAQLNGWSALDVLDEISRDVSTYTELFDGDGEIIPELADVYAGGLVVADQVTVESVFRGRGLGPLLLAETLLDLGAGCELAVGTPAPFEEPTGSSVGNGGTVVSDLAAAARWNDRQDELRALWARLGFRPIGATGIFALDLLESTLQSALHDIRANVYGGPA